jgi:hypothetical protein
MTTQQIESHVKTGELDRRAYFMHQFNSNKSKKSHTISPQNKENWPSNIPRVSQQDDFFKLNSNPLD